MKKYRLENWSVVGVRENPYQAPELMQFALRGFVYGHPKCKDGHVVITSNIIGTDGKNILTRSGSYYQLGEIDPIYEELYPNAQQRLLNSLEEQQGENP